MFIKYFVPEDGDDAQHPNCFQVDGSGSASLSAIRKAFPLPGYVHIYIDRGDRGEGKKEGMMECGG